MKENGRDQRWTGSKRSTGPKKEQAQTRKKYQNVGERASKGPALNQDKAFYGGPNPAIKRVGHEEAQPRYKNKIAAGPPSS